MKYNTRMEIQKTEKDNKLKYKFVCIQKYIWKYDIKDLMMMNREKDRKQ